ncbi:DUF1273 domain-containing protein [Domibacillus epiphyticus]|uniref:UPF0398 protein BTO28_09475 n=1 Tax=Domibacillus epiphyticus TaxID=1714355 RepID=A0A1V2A7N5_9BACI|nr:DUF1273 domain-containing protein [Domibacillus epiphyticus]OMP66957.1 hypothetical protein BTO28_09475 [Domibacillus epiphyticus]
MYKTILLSGYKSHELGIWDQKNPGIFIIKTAIEKQLRSLIEEGLEWVIIGGQPGVELWGAEVVLELKDEYPDLKLGVLMPFLEQEKNWKEERQEYYHTIIDQADFVDAVSKKPYIAPWQFKARDEFALDHTDALLLVYDEEKEGSPKFIKSAADKRVESDNYSLVSITMYDLQTAAEDIQEKERSDW